MKKTCKGLYETVPGLMDTVRVILGRVTDINGYGRISGGFATCSDIQEMEDSYIVTVVSGVQSDCEDRTHVDTFVIEKSSLPVPEKEDAIAKEDIACLRCREDVEADQVPTAYQNPHNLPNYVTISQVAGEKCCNCDHHIVWKFERSSYNCELLAYSSRICKNGRCDKWIKETGSNHEQN